MNWADVYANPSLRQNAGEELFSHNYCRSLHRGDSGAWCFREDALRTRVSEDKNSAIVINMAK